MSTTGQKPPAKAAETETSISAIMTWTTNNRSPFLPTPVTTVQTASNETPADAEVVDEEEEEEEEEGEEEINTDDISTDSEDDTDDDDNDVETAEMLTRLTRRERLGRRRSAPIANTTLMTDTTSLRRPPLPTAPRILRRQRANADFGFDVDDNEPPAIRARRGRPMSPFYTMYRQNRAAGANTTATTVRAAAAAATADNNITGTATVAGAGTETGTSTGVDIGTATVENTRPTHHVEQNLSRHRDILPPYPRLRRVSNFERTGTEDVAVFRRSAVVQRYRARMAERAAAAADNDNDNDNDNDSAVAAEVAVGDGERRQEAVGGDDGGTRGEEQEEDGE